MQKYNIRDKSKSPSPSPSALKVTTKQESEMKYESDIPNGTNKKTGAIFGKRKNTQIITPNDITDPYSEHFGNHGLGNLI